MRWKAPAGRGVRGDRRRAHFARPFTKIELCVPEQGTPFLLSARLRLRRAVPGDRRRAHCASPLTLADEVQVFSFIQERKRSEKALRSFLPLIIASRRAQEASGTGLLGITAPRGAVPRLWTPTLPRVQPPFCFGSVVQWGITPLPFRITGGFTNLVNRNRLQYAPRRRCSGPCQTFQLCRGKGAAEECQTWTKRLAVHPLPRRSRKIGHGKLSEMALSEPLTIKSHSSWGWPLVIKNGRGVMPH